MTFALNSRRLSGALAVNDDEALAAMDFAFRHLKLVLEPGGAAALVIASGGNVEAAVFGRAIRARTDASEAVSREFGCRPRTASR
jgi:threonine dehydratase